MLYLTKHMRIQKGENQPSPNTRRAHKSAAALLLPVAIAAGQRVLGVGIAANQAAYARQANPFETPPTDKKAFENLPTLNAEQLYGQADYSVSFTPEFARTTLTDTQKKKLDKVFATYPYIALNTPGLDDIDDDQARAYLEQLRVEQIVALNHASHVETVTLHKSGVQLNIWAANTEDDAFSVNVDPRALSVIFETVVQSIDTSPGSYIPVERGTQIKKLATTGGLDNTVFHIMLSANPKRCVSKSNTPSAYSQIQRDDCAGGVAISQMPDSEQNTVAPPSNLLVVLPAPTEYNRTRSAGWQTGRVTVHELGHHMAAIANLSGQQRTQNPTDDPYAVEHATLTARARALVQETTRDLTVSEQERFASPFQFAPSKRFETVNDQLEKAPQLIEATRQSIEEAISSQQEFEAYIYPGELRLMGKGAGVLAVNPIVMKDPLAEEATRTDDYVYFTTYVEGALPQRGGNTEVSETPEGYYIFTTANKVGNAMYFAPANMNKSGNLPKPIKVTFAAGQDLIRGSIVATDPSGRQYFVTLPFLLNTPN